jgi:hypothetical protein
MGSRLDDFTPWQTSSLICNIGQIGLTTLNGKNRTRTSKFREANEVNPPDIERPIIGSYSRRVTVAVCWNPGMPVSTTRENEQILNRSSLQHPGRVNLALALLHFTLCTVENGINVPASNQPSENIVRTRQFRRRSGRRQCLQKSLWLHHLNCVHILPQPTTPGLDVRSSHRTLSATSSYA